MPTDDSLIALTTEAIEKLDLAINEILKISKRDRAEKYKIGRLGSSIALIKEFQYQIRPELIPPLEEPDPPLTDEQSARVAQLTEAEIKKIDERLLSNSADKWHKVTRIVGTTLVELQESLQNIPDLYYAERVRHLVKEGKLESRGDLSRMRYSEIRLPPNET